MKSRNRMSVLALATFLLLGLPAAGAIAADLPPLSHSLTKQAPKPAPLLKLKGIDGATHDLAQLRGRVVLVNFWATWCPPCVREMPAIDRFHREFAPRGWQVLGLAVDRPAPVREYLARAPVSYAIAMAGFGGTSLTRQLGNTKDGLPFTAVFGRDGRIARRKLGETSFEELAGWAAAA